MGSVTSILTGGLIGGKKKKSDPAPREKVSDPNLRRDRGGSTEADQAKTQQSRAAARRKRVLGQKQVGGPGGRAGLRTSLSAAPTRSGIGIQ